MTGPVPRAITIAGSDSGGGAGIQADLKTFAALGVFGLSAITALTAQNTTGVRAVVGMSPAFVREQIDAVLSDIGADAAKTGMLGSPALVEAVADAVLAWRIDRLVVDPVMISKSGAPLLHPDARAALRRALLPLALVVTPNLHEAGVLLDRPVETLAAMEDAARALHAFGPRYVVVKGGHLPGAAVDVLFDGQTMTRLESARIETRHTHGTGCVFSAAIAAGLARGAPAVEAIRDAKAFITAAIRDALPLGSGHGPANPMHGSAGRAGR